MLSPIGWLDGVTALIVVISGILFGVLSMIKSVKLEAKLLGITGLTTLSAGFVLLGPAVDFLTILLTGHNLQPYWLYGLLSYAWTGPVTIFGLYIGSELILPDKKKLIVGVYTVLSVIFEIILFLFSFTNPSLIFEYTADTGNENLLNTSVVLASPIFILMMLFLISGLIFNGFGFLRKSFQSTGDIKRKFLYLSLGWILFIVCGALDALTDPGIVTFFIRIGMILSIAFMYLGVRIK
ncbi:MAG: hypothetical protein GF383_04560 [Candidatus Lokiarchaeota archaeon]|nr:hypothetical protein [Candidatus Lokiarchaeota archaeon]MBD3339057.1 hypothetical protein [Candidatus Lokiarchaeota archaeon]